MRGTVPSRTILAQNGQQGMPASHPLFYTQQRSKYLQRLAGQSAIESDLPTNDLRRNMRIDHYLNEYNHVRGKLEKQQQMDRRGKERQKKEVRSMQEELYQNYVENPQVYRPAERDQVEEIEGPQTVLEMGGDRRKQLYLLDLEIDRLKREDEITKTVQYKHQTCRNNELLGRLSSTLVSSYLVHFEQIVGLLLDQMLEDEVIHLNYLEAQYKMAPYQKQPPSRKTVQMAELVRALDDLCDQ